MSEGTEFSRLSYVKECPVCGGELEKGYVIPPRGIGWDAKRHKRDYVTPEIVVPPGHYGMFTPYWTVWNAQALRCRNCHIIVLQYVAAEAETPKSFMKKCLKCDKEIPLDSEECPYCGTMQKE